MKPHLPGGGDGICIHWRTCASGKLSISFTTSPTATATADCKPEHWISSSPTAHSSQMDKTEWRVNGGKANFVVGSFSENVGHHHHHTSPFPYFSHMIQQTGGRRRSQLVEWACAFVAAADTRLTSLACMSEVRSIGFGVRRQAGVDISLQFKQ